MVASKTMRLSGEVTPGFLKAFLGGDPKGELQVSREVGTVLKFVIEDYEFCRIFRRIVDLLLMNR